MPGLWMGSGRKKSGGKEGGGNVVLGVSTKVGKSAVEE